MKQSLFKDMQWGNWLEALSYTVSLIPHCRDHAGGLLTSPANELAAGTTADFSLHLLHLGIHNSMCAMPHQAVLSQWPSRAGGPRVKPIYLTWGFSATPHQPGPSLSLVSAFPPVLQALPPRCIRTSVGMLGTFAAMGLFLHKIY